MIIRELLTQQKEVGLRKDMGKVNPKIIQSRIKAEVQMENELSWYQNRPNKRQIKASEWH